MTCPSLLIAIRTRNGARIGWDLISQNPQPPSHGPLLSLLILVQFPGVGPGLVGSRPSNLTQGQSTNTVWSGHFFKTQAAVRTVAGFLLMLLIFHDDGYATFRSGNCRRRTGGFGLCTKGSTRSKSEEMLLSIKAQKHTWPSPKQTVKHCTRAPTMECILQSPSPLP